jgi:hypothetical protein
MGVDVDPEVLAAAAAASAHAYEQAIVHVGEEIKARDPGNLTALMGSLAPEGPYAYTIMPRVSADGTIELPVLTTREEIHGAYEFVRGLSDLHEVIGLNEVAGAWYLFQDGMTVGGPKDSDVRNHRQTLGLFPSGTERGITGELVWLRSPREGLGGPDDVDAFAEDDELHARHRIHGAHQAYLAGLRANDLDAILEPIHDLASSAIRDYVAGTGALIELTGKDAHRAWFGELLAAFEVREVQAIHLVTADWYVFAELRITADRRDGSGTVAFHTAEFHVVARDGRFIARIGHGTEPVARG